MGPGEELGPFVRERTSMNIWLITDTHFGHEKIREYCGRPENFERIIFKYLVPIPESDALIHLGDVCLGKEAEIHARYIEPLRCRKWLVRGNHDQRPNTWYLQHGWDFVCEEFGYVHTGKRILFSHTPVNWDKSFDVNIHGHSHNSEPSLPIASEHHILLAIEYTEYKPVTLASLLRSLP